MGIVPPSQPIANQESRVSSPTPQRPLPGGPWRRPQSLPARWDDATRRPRRGGAGRLRGQAPVARETVARRWARRGCSGSLDSSGSSPAPGLAERPHLRARPVPPSFRWGQGVCRAPATARRAAGGRGDSGASHALLTPRPTLACLTVGLARPGAGAPRPEGLHFVNAATLQRKGARGVNRELGTERRGVLCRGVGAEGGDVRPSEARRLDVRCVRPMRESCRVCTCVCAVRSLLRLFANNPLQ